MNKFRLDQQGLLKPVIAKPDLNAIELRVTCAQVGVGDVQPMTAEIERSPTRGEDVNSATAADGEIDAGSVAYMNVRGFRM